MRRTTLLLLIVSCAVGLVFSASRSQDNVACEVRWFFEGSIPSPVNEWFDNHLPGDNLDREDPRDDLYLIYEGRDDTNLKLREGKFAPTFAPLLAEAILRIAENRSVSSLFD